MARKTPARFTLAHIGGHERKSGQHALNTVKELQAIDPAVIAAIIASGPTNTNDEFVGGAISNYTGDDVIEYEDMIRRHIPKDDIKAQDTLGLINMYAGERGYMLGLAVGLALGSGRPFDGIKKGGAR